MRRKLDSKICSIKNNTALQRFTDNTSKILIVENTFELQLKIYFPSGYDNDGEKLLTYVTNNCE